MIFGCQCILSNVIQSWSAISSCSFASFRSCVKELLLECPSRNAKIARLQNQIGVDFGFPTHSGLPVAYPLPPHTPPSPEKNRKKCFFVVEILHFFRGWGGRGGAQEAFLWRIPMIIWDRSNSIRNQNHRNQLKAVSGCFPRFIVVLVPITEISSLSSEYSPFAFGWRSLTIFQSADFWKQIVLI